MKIDKVGVDCWHKFSIFVIFSQRFYFLYESRESDNFEPSTPTPTIVDRN